MPLPRFFLYFWIKRCIFVHFVHSYLLRDTYAAYRHSSGYARVCCLSVCLFVTRRCFINAAERIITQSTENWDGHSAITSLDLWPQRCGNIGDTPNFLFVGFVQIPWVTVENSRGRKFNPKNLPWPRPTARTFGARRNAGVRPTQILFDGAATAGCPDDWFVLPERTHLREARLRWKAVTWNCDLRVVRLLMH